MKRHYRDAINLTIVIPYNIVVPYIRYHYRDSINHYRDSTKPTKDCRFAPTGRSLLPDREAFDRCSIPGSPTYAIGELYPLQGSARSIPLRLPQVLPNKVLLRTGGGLLRPPSFHT